MQDYILGAFFGAVCSMCPDTGFQEWDTKCHWSNYHDFELFESRIKI